MLGQQLDDAFGPAGGLRDEYLQVLPVAPPLDLGDPVAEAPTELQRRLTGDVPVSGFRAAWPRLVDFQAVDRHRAGKPRGHVIVVHLELGRVRRQVAPRGGVRVARPHLADRLPETVRGLDRFSHDEPDRGASNVVVESRSTVNRGPILHPLGVIRHALELFGQRADRHVIERRHRPLRRRIEAAERLDVVTDELRPDREGLSRRKQVDHAATPAELAVRLDRVGTREAGVHQAVGQIGRGAGYAEPELYRGAQQPLGRAEPRQERRRGRDDDPRLTLGKRGQRARARGGHVQVRGHAAVRVHLGRGKGQHAALDVASRKPFEPGQEEPGVACHAVNARVVRNHEDHRPDAGEDGRRQRLGGRGQATDRPAGVRPTAPDAGAGGRRAEQGAERQGRSG